MIQKGSKFEHDQGGVVKLAQCAQKGPGPLYDC